MNCALRNNDSSCEDCGVAEQCEIFKEYQKKVLDAVFDRCLADKADGTVRTFLAANQTEAIIAIKGKPQVVEVLRILGEAGASILKKRFV